MAEGDWRNLPVYHGGGPNGSGMWYEEPGYSTVEFTPAASGDGSDGEPIEVIRRRIMNQHPEDISALADQWQNAYNLLSSIRQQLLDQSNILYEQAWRSARARDAFMEKDPGEALAYLQDWMDAALDNVNGLRALVDIAQRSRADMENLWNRYQSEIEDASNADGWTRFGQGFLTGASLGFYDGEAGVQKSEQEAVRKKQQEFNKLAQELAFNVGNQYGETFSTLGGGHGALFRPMNAVLNTVGHPPFPTIGAGPSSLGGPAGGPGAAPTITPPNALSNPPLPTPGAPPFQPADVTPPVAPGQVPVPTGQLNSQPDVAPPPAVNPVFGPVALPAALVAPPPAANRASPGLPAAAAAPAAARAAPNAANAALPHQAEHGRQDQRQRPEQRPDPGQGLRGADRWGDAGCAAFPGSRAAADRGPGAAGEAAARCLEAGTAGAGRQGPPRGTVQRYTGGHGPAGTEQSAPCRAAPTRQPRGTAPDGAGPARYPGSAAARRCGAAGVEQPGQQSDARAASRADQAEQAGTSRARAAGATGSARQTRAGLRVGRCAGCASGRVRACPRRACVATHRRGRVRAGGDQAARPHRHYAAGQIPPGVRGRAGADRASGQARRYGPGTGPGRACGQGSADRHRR
ncbi:MULTISPECIES: hypothetical protein [Protofrankia]|uniref:Uncharacterized protein n=1 Tax=Candidatus Protofrankia datiscae TaxID=2716812 RepID=F8B0W2_9ACTN|nr:MULTISPECIES: hypothetical protein [Protofrankia]AEH07784.1 hypothetical protein FsymDg_0212 [Candidatus Protofrankia datiscae]